MLESGGVINWLQRVGSLCCLILAGGLVWMVQAPIYPATAQSLLVLLAATETLRRSPRDQSYPKSRLIIGFILSLALQWFLVFGSHPWDYYYGFIATLNAMGLWLLNREPGRVSLWSWRTLSFCWAGVGGVIFLLTAYFANDYWIFLLSLVGLTALAFTANLTVRVPKWGLMLVTTVAMFLPGLWLVDALLSFGSREQKVPRAADRAYTYETFKRDPAAFTRWMTHFQEQGGNFFRTAYVKTAGHDSLGVLKSNFTVRFCEAEIRLNNFGFRGADLTAEKGDAYRVVLLGESTTFGITIERDWLPWGELLAQMIRERLAPNRPIEVINAGIPGITLHENLDRLAWQILPLQPDLIISYHGFNQFSSLDATLPPVRTRLPPPRFQPRPITLLANAEYRWRMLRYARQLSERTVGNAPANTNFMTSQYAADYRELIRTCRDNGVKLVLATYSMAVNAQSDPDLIQFYHQMEHSLNRQMQACVAHAEMVRQLAQQNDIAIVDTQPALDGKPEYFIDLVHFTIEGQQRMAETIYAGIVDLLRRELTHPAQTNAFTP